MWPEGRCGGTSTPMKNAGMHSGKRHRLALSAMLLAALCLGLGAGGSQAASPESKQDGQEPLKVLLNQTDPVRLGRNMTYYGYLTRARSERLISIGERFEHLNVLTEGINVAAEKLKTLEADSARELELLAAARAERARRL